MRPLVAVVLAPLLTMAILEAQESPAARPASPHTVMMQAVVKITGPGKNAKETTTGSGFLVERPNASSESGKDYIAVTAAHVLKEITGDQATFQIPFTRPDGAQQRIFLATNIRQRGAQLWTELPGADVAVLYVNLPPTGVKPIGLDRLATDEDVEQVLLLGVGDIVHVLTFPFGYEFNQFPVVRNVALASHPLVPARAVKRLVVDFASFGGESGGPLYVGSRSETTPSGEDFKILGIVTQQVLSPDRTQNAGLTFVTPAVFVREAIGLLPQRVAAAR